MLLTCPHCGTLVHPDARIGDVAQCPGCDQVFEAPAAAAPAKATAAIPVTLGPSPPGVHVRHHPNGIELVLPWRKNINIVGIALHSLLVAAPVVGVSQEPSLEGLTFLFFFVGPLGYNLLYNLVNATHVFIAKGGVEVDHGPLPSFNRAARIDARSARRLLLEAKQHHTAKGATWTTYHLHAPHTDTYLLKEWNHQATLTYVRDAIEAIHPPARDLSDADLLERASLSRLS